MLDKKVFFNFLRNWSTLAFSAVFLFILASSSSWSMSQEVDYLQKLPKRVAYYLFSFLPPEDLGRLSRVSKSFKTLAEADECWKTFNVTTKAEYVKYIKENPILFKMFNASSQKKFEIEFACEGRGHRFGHFTKQPFSYFASYSATLKFKPYEEITIRFMDLPEKIRACGIDKLYGITKLPAKNPMPTLPLIDVWEDQESPCQKNHEVSFLYDIKKAKPLFVLHQSKNYASFLIYHITEKNKYIYEEVSKNKK